MTEQLISELQSDFSRGGIEFLASVSRKSSILLEIIKPNLNYTDNNMPCVDDVRGFIKVNEGEFSSMEASFAFTTLMNSLLDRGYGGAVWWCIQNIEQISNKI